MHEVKKNLGNNKAEYDLYLIFKNQISWKFKERESIVKLFEMVPRDKLSTYDPVDIKSLESSFKDVQSLDVMKKFANLVYSIRNSNVHQGESEDGNTLEISADCWPKLTYCLFLIVEHLYSEYQEGMPQAHLP